MAMEAARYGHEAGAGASTKGSIVSPIEPVIKVTIPIRTQGSPPFLTMALHDACKTAAVNTVMIANGSKSVTVNMNALVF